ncbi:MAG: hypothetical protein QOK03_3107 [Candidatus Binataceae bacterium]|jgi:hypothetical protein|nr:hypothetical protein [Candidatus Binataceae bacterium]
MILFTPLKTKLGLTLNCSDSYDFVVDTDRERFAG